jgi:SHAQKYF class myb-like DNA-binding protein
MNGEKIGAIRIELRALQGQSLSPSMRVCVPIDSFVDEAQQDPASSDANTGRWTKAEHKRFLEALKLYGKDWKKVQEYVGTRTTTQARSHAQKYFSKIGREDRKDDEFYNGDEDSAERCPVTSLNKTVNDVAKRTDKSANTQSTFISTQGTPQKVVETPLSPADKTRPRPRKRLRGPFRPGKRPIKCDLPCENRKKLRDSDIPDKHNVLDTLCPTLPSRIPDDLADFDKSLRLRPSFLSHESGDFLHQWSEKSQMSEPDFDVAPMETIRPLEIEPSSADKEV